MADSSLEIEAKISSLRALFRNRPATIDNVVRDSFYSLAAFFSDLLEDTGPDRTKTLAAMVLDWMMSPQWRSAIMTSRAETFGHLLRIAQAEPRSVLDQPAIDICAGRFSAALLDLAEKTDHLDENTRKFEEIIPTGPETGLAAWQILNPFYYIWSVLEPNERKATERWRDPFFDNHPSPQQTETDEQEPGQEADFQPIDTLMSWLGDLLRSHGSSSFRVLECGMGHGHLVRPLIRHLKVAPKDFFGFDLHGTRVSVSRDVLASLVAESDDNERVALADQIFVLDIMSDNAASVIAGHKPVDVIFSSSFTNVFEDTQLHHVLSILAGISPRFIADLSVTTSWGYCVGRPDMSAHYQQHGYRSVGSRFEQKPLPFSNGSALWLPQRYWANRNLQVFENTRGTFCNV
ncbi:MAG: hypothetical protein O3B74_12000 [Proteobacteria bacterium]|nr:hypothetical protein [Pseudomonadota bacterium]MDA1309823.1 hypothetical protein [Pseudomonadota bacterium]